MSVPSFAESKIITVDEFVQVKREIELLKKTNSLLPKYPVMCSGPVFFNSCLIAIIIVCVLGILLSSLGLVGVFPPILALFGAVNLIWMIVSSSIIAVMSTIFAVCMAVFCSKYHQSPPPLVNHNTEFLHSTSQLLE